MSYACRSCGSSHVVEFLDLGSMPIASCLVTDEDGRAGILPRAYPLKAVFCSDCTLVSITETVDAKELFIDNYNYYASFSPSVVRHAEHYAEEMVAGLGLDPRAFVVELASNDGYQLQFFRQRGIPCVGFEPSPGPARAAREKSIDTIPEFFGLELARACLAGAHGYPRGRHADLIIANNVLAHVRDLNDFLAGVSLLLDDDGTATFENPWLKLLLDETQFDTIYHEHVCYFSTHAVQAACARHHLEVTDVRYFDKLHGGMLRWTVRRQGRDSVSPAVAEILREEQRAGLTTDRRFLEFGDSVAQLKKELLAQLASIQRQGKRLAAYGAVAKGATLTNYLGLTAHDVRKVYDRNTNKVGAYLPGSLIPVAHADDLAGDAPDVVLILAWNFADEIVAQQRPYLENGGCFLVPIPRPKLINLSTVNGDSSHSSEES